MNAKTRSPGGALGGVRVLDVGAYVAGPYAGTLLADMGADVIKVEPPGGDNLRNYPSTLQDECRFFMGANRGKRGIVLDLKDERGLKALLRLVETADVLMHNFRPGVTQRLGLAYEQLVEINPRLIYASMTGYGSTGPMSGNAAYDQVLQSMAGLAHGQAKPGQPPDLVQGSVVDYFGASLLAVGIAGALYERERSGRGQEVEMSLLAATLSLQSGRFIWAEGEPKNVDRNVRSIGVNGIFPTRDGHFYLQATTPHFWDAVCRLTGCDDMATDPAYDTVRKRLERKDQISARLAQALATRTSEEWERIFGCEVPCAVVRSLDELFDHPQVIAQDLVARYEHPVVGSYRALANPIKFLGTPVPPTRSAPALGQHTAEVLREAGCDEKVIEAITGMGGSRPLAKT